MSSHVDGSDKQEVIRVHVLNPICVYDGSPVHRLGRKYYPSVTLTNEWHAMEKTTWPWIIVSLKDTMGTMGRDPQISENVFFGDPRGHSSGS